MRLSQEQQKQIIEALATMTTTTARLYGLGTQTRSTSSRRRRKQDRRRHQLHLTNLHKTTAKSRPHPLTHGLHFVSNSDQPSMFALSKMSVRSASLPLLLLPL